MTRINVKNVQKNDKKKYFVHLHFFAMLVNFADFKSEQSAEYIHAKCEMRFEVCANLEYFFNVYLNLLNYNFK